jgi:hypothetical protein
MISLLAPSTASPERSLRRMAIFVEMEFLEFEREMCSAAEGLRMA